MFNLTFITQKVLSNETTPVVKKTCKKKRISSQTERSAKRKTNCHEKYKQNSNSSQKITPRKRISKQNSTLGESISQQKSTADDKEYNDHESNEDSDSDSGLSLNSQGVRNLEIEDKVMLGNMKKSYLYFKTNVDGRVGGYGKFPYHLMSYLFHRSLSHKKGKYNPTAKCETDLFAYQNACQKKERMLKRT